MSAVISLASPLVALSLASDLGVGLDVEHSARTTYLATRYALERSVSEAERSAVFYAGLLRNVGCLADAHDLSRAVHASDLAYKAAAWFVDFGDSRQALRFALRNSGTAVPAVMRPLAVLDALRSREIVYEGLREQCEVGALFAREIGLGEDVAGSILAAWDRWDGLGVYGRKGLDNPLPMRLVAVASVAHVFHSAFGPDVALEQVRSQAGTSLDPDLAGGFGDWWARTSPWRAFESDALESDLFALEPTVHRRTIDEAGLDGVLRGYGDFADLKMPWTVGHARSVRAIAVEAGRRLRLPAPDLELVGRAGYVLDIGRATIPNTILERAGPLTTRDREVVRLHPYHSERILARSPVLAPLAPLAGMHHERLDGSGYYRSSGAAQLPVAARLLATADVADALCQDRPHRRARTPDAAAGTLRDEARRGRLDPDCVEAVCGALTGAKARHRSEVLGLTGREVEVVRLLAAGMLIKEIAKELQVSPKTVEHHVQHLYGKLGVTTRAGAVMAAVNRGLVG